jgi:hypothetical protein
MDPVSIIGLTASAVQLCDLALDIIVSLTHYCKEVKAAPKQAMELRDEISILNSSITMLTITLRSGSINIPHSDRVQLSTTIGKCETTLQELSQTLKGTSTSTKVLKRFKWPFQQNDIDAYLARIQRYKTILTDILQVGQTYVSSRSTCS